MIKLNYFIILIFYLLFLPSCKAIKEKTNTILEKENKELSKYIGKTSETLILGLGQPDNDYKNEQGNLEYTYKNKKYGILCERKFEINSDSIIIGFISKGCF